MNDRAEAPNLFADVPAARPAAQRRTTGILPSQTLRELMRAGAIAAAPHDIAADQVQPASLDLRLGRQAFRVRASFLPGSGVSVADKIGQLDGHPMDLSDGAVLERGCIYVVQLQEALRLPADHAGFANPKSTTGRLDILTRLIADGGTAFDEIEAGYAGPLYIEIVPLTFSVVVRQGAKLNQLRLVRGGPKVPQGQLQSQYEAGHLIRPFDPKNKLPDTGLVPVTIDLKGGGRNGLIGYRAKKHTDRIDLARVGFYDPSDFWEPLHAARRPELTLDPDEFYILVTDEEVRVPPDFAAEMVPYHTRSGEYRVHYAGFFDPGFGWDVSRGGSRAVLEVRSHEVPFVLEHGQIVGWLRYEWMAGQPDRLYGLNIGSSYQSQGLALSKQFRQSNFG